jgi:8-oxo-dGTP pyrophosphatase MutT (NUDIX family)
MSAFEELRAKLEKSSENSTISSSIDEFYRQQKAEKEGDKKTKVQAAHMLHHFRGAIGIPTTPSFKSRTLTKAFPDEENGAANRAAAALFLNTSATSNAIASESSTSPKINVRSLGDFYQAQRRRRLQDALTRQKTSDLNRSYKGLLTSGKDLSESYVIPPNLVRGSSQNKQTLELQSTVTNSKISKSNDSDNLRTSQITSETEVTTSSDDVLFDQLGVEEIENPVVAVDHKSVDYRAFVFAVHAQHGLLLLHCTRKAKKGPHFQLPGGHVDEPEFLTAARTSTDAHAQLIIAAQMGAARELFEETHIDVRNELYRMEPAALRNEILTGNDGKYIMTCELKRRLYFFLPVTDDDFVKPKSISENCKLVAPMTEEGNHLRLQLSPEHSGFRFEKDPILAANLLESHSGGNGSKALLMAMKREEEEKLEAETSILSVNTSVDDQEDNGKPAEETFISLGTQTPAKQENPLLSDRVDDMKTSALDIGSSINDQDDTAILWEDLPLLSVAERQMGSVTPKRDLFNEKDPLLLEGSKKLSESPSSHLNLLPPAEKKNVFTCCLWFQS